MSAFDSLFSNEVFEATFGTDFVYTRDSTEVSITAMDSKIDTDRQLEYGATTISESKEFVFKLSEISGTFSEPQRGDTITDAYGNTWQLAQVGSAPEWEYDNDREYIRIRAVLIGG